MKKIFLIIITIIYASCSTIKHKNSSYFILRNKEIVNDGEIILHIKNNSTDNLLFLINENPKYFKNFIFIKYQNFPQNLKIIVEDENGDEVNLLLGRNTIHFQDYDKYKNDIISSGCLQPSLVEVNHNREFEIKIPFKIINKDISTDYSYEYSFEKDKTYFVRIEYFLNSKIIDSLKEKGIKIYDKPIVSNRVPIKFE